MVWCFGEWVMGARRAAKRILVALGVAADTVPSFAS